MDREKLAVFTSLFSRITDCLDAIAFQNEKRRCDRRFLGWVESIDSRLISARKANKKEVKRCENR